MKGMDSLSSVDLSVAFFSSVLVLFVFVQFHLVTTPPNEEQITIGQSEQYLTAIPSTWDPIPKRGEFAFYSNDKIYLLNMEFLANTILDPTSNISSDDAYTSTTLGSGAAPEQFVMKISFRPERIPEEWISRTAIITVVDDTAKEEIPEIDQPDRQVGSKTDCFNEQALAGVDAPDDDTSILNLLTVWVDPKGGENLDELVGWGKQCGFRLRIEVLKDPPASGRLSRAIVISPRAFSSSAIFR